MGKRERREKSGCFEVEEEKRNKSELKGSETMCGGIVKMEGIKSAEEKRGEKKEKKVMTGSFCLQKGYSDSSCPGSYMTEVKKNESEKRTLKAPVTSRVFAKTASLAGGLLHVNDNSNLSERDQGCGRNLFLCFLPNADSDRLLKIQDPVHSFRSIELKESDCALLRGKIKEMENKVNWLQTELLKTREAKSQLKLQNVEWERELCSMRY
ncbi:Ankyrin repeat domain-containing protein 26 [Camelus dromedarius]|uniref:Ankyrin repeat domain-containing protein 26 n=1 Tax=Camelus dromedarius TaxID=9838 RepID=A0A5N4CN87_CAMDR|nr:Ankyrin repeat domain-containing protein 26 [Camelus dromedarius]